MRVALLIPYFGKLPALFPYYAASVSAIARMDVHLFTDTALPGHLPTNMYVHAFSLQDFCRLAAHKTGVAVEFSQPYKCCDFRPAYGRIFEDFIAEYPYWGYGDLDVIYGNIDAAIKEYCSGNDIVSFREGWLSGSLCFLKNSTLVNSLYLQSRDWKTVFSSPRSFLFDELGGRFYGEVMSGADPLSLHGEVVSFTHIVKSLEKDRNLRCIFQDMVCEQIQWGRTLQYGSGKIQDIKSGEEFSYLHWVIMKRRFFHAPPVSVAPATFFIRNTGIYAQRPGVYEALLKEPCRILSGIAAMTNRKIFGV